MDDANKMQVESWRMSSVLLRLGNWGRWTGEEKSDPRILSIQHDRSTSDTIEKDGQCNSEQMSTTEAHESESLCTSLELSGRHNQLDIGAQTGMTVRSRMLQFAEECTAVGDAVTWREQSSSSDDVERGRRCPWSLPDM